MSGDATPTGTISAIDPGAVVYDAEGNAVGVVSGVAEDGFNVTVLENAADGEDSPTEDTPSIVDHEEHPGKSFGEGYLMWRCDECGEMGDLEGGMPTECPSCRASKNAMYRTEED